MRSEPQCRRPVFNERNKKTLTPLRRFRYKGEIGRIWTLSSGRGRATARCKMHYRLEITTEALTQLRALPKEQRRRLGRKIDALQTDLAGDVRKLTGQGGRYRLRVGTIRVLFTLETDLILVLVVKDRKDAYRD